MAAWQDRKSLLTVGQNEEVGVLFFEELSRLLFGVGFGTTVAVMRVQGCNTVGDWELGDVSRGGIKKRPVEGNSGSRFKLCMTRVSTGSSL